MFRPAREIKEKTGVFVALTGTTNSGKTWSALELARGMAGEGGKIAVLDTEGGRTLHLKNHFDFDVMVMGAPFRPHLFSEAAQEAERAGYACLLIDSFTQEWTGLGGVLSWHDEEAERLQGVAAWAKPKAAHKAMVNSLLQRRIPIVFSIRGEEGVKPAEKGAASRDPVKIYKSLTDKNFPFEVTVAFRLAADRKGYIDLSDPVSFKMEGAHLEIFKHGDRLSRDHGTRLLAWSQGLDAPTGSRSTDALLSEGNEAAARGSDALKAFWGRIGAAGQKAVGGKETIDRWKAIAAEVDGQIAEEERAA
jgi:hypothetical protein